MGLRFRMNLIGKDEVYLARVEGYHKALFNLEMFKSAPEHISVQRSEQVLEKYRTHFEAGKSGNRIEIALRNQARQEVTAFFKAVLHFLHCVATENDVPKILEAGLERCKNTRRKGKATPDVAAAGEVIA